MVESKEPGGSLGGNVTFHHQQMRRTSARPIDQLTLDWRAISRGSDSKRALELLAAEEPDVAATKAADLYELVALLRDAIGDPHGAWAPGVIQAMVRSQAVHRMIPRAILQALLPGLVTVARRLSWGAGGDWVDGGTFFTDLTTTAWEVVTEWAGQDRPYALLDLLSAIRCRMRRQIVSRRTDKEIAASPDLERRLGTKMCTGLSDLEILAQAIEDLTGNQLDPTDAAVLYGNRVLGLSMTELARLTGRSRRFLADRRRRAEEQFCA
jgi:hypothetical protein